MRVTISRIGVVLWIGVIFFSSTSLAAQWCEELFATLSSMLLPHLSAAHPSYKHLHFIAEKSVHVTLFMLFAVLLWNAIPNKPRKITAIFLSSLLVACMAEFIQFFFPGRDPALRDVMIDLGGTAIGVGIITKIFAKSVKAERTVSRGGERATHAMRR